MVPVRQVAVGPSLIIIIRQVFIYIACISSNIISAVAIIVNGSDQSVWDETRRTVPVLADPGKMLRNACFRPIHQFVVSKTKIAFRPQAEVFVDIFSIA